MNAGSNLPAPMRANGSESDEVLVALVRHGAYEQPAGVPSAWLPHPLVDEGRMQAQRAADQAQSIASERGVSIATVIDASELLRAWETAQIIASSLGPPHHVESFSALNERGLGAAANLTLDEIHGVLLRDPRYTAPPQGWKARSGYRLPVAGAETLLEAGARVASHLEWRAAQAKAGTMQVCVGHGAAFRHAAHALGVLPAAELAGLSMHHGSLVVLARRSDGTWSHVAGHWKVRNARNEFTR